MLTYLSSAVYHSNVSFIRHLPEHSVTGQVHWVAEDADPVEVSHIDSVATEVTIKFAGTTYQVKTDITSIVSRLTSMLLTIGDDVIEPERTARAGSVFVTGWSDRQASVLFAIELPFQRREDHEPQPVTRDMIASVLAGMIASAHTDQRKSQIALGLLHGWAATHRVRVGANYSPVVELLRHMRLPTPGGLLEPVAADMANEAALRDLVHRDAVIAYTLDVCGAHTEGVLATSIYGPAVVRQFVRAMSAACSTLFALAFPYSLAETKDLLHSDISPYGDGYGLGVAPAMLTSPDCSLARAVKVDLPATVIAPGEKIPTEYLLAFQLGPYRDIPALCPPDRPSVVSVSHVTPPNPTLGDLNEEGVFPGVSQVICNAHIQLPAVKYYFSVVDTQVEGVEIESPLAAYEQQRRITLEARFRAEQARFQRAMLEEQHRIEITPAVARVGVDMDVIVHGDAVPDEVREALLNPLAAGGARANPNAPAEDEFVFAPIDNVDNPRPQPVGAPEDH